MKKKNMNHTTIRNHDLLCLNCGGRYTLLLPIPLDEMTGKMKAFNTLHEHCPAPKKI